MGKNDSSRGPAPQYAVGDKVGRLTMLEYIPRRGSTASKGRFKCDCGQEVERSLQDVRRVVREGGEPSCGCASRKPAGHQWPTMPGPLGQLIDDLTGLRVGKIQAVRPGKLEIIAPDGSKKERTMWLCVCDCGEELLVNANALKHRDVTQCKTCAEGARYSPLDRAAMIKLSNMRYRNPSVSLTLEDVKGIIIKPCWYCGREPTADEAGVMRYSTVDRVDSKRGYHLDNVVPCCIQCNKAKSDDKKEVFLAWVEKVHDYQQRTKSTPVAP